jgi:DNA-binding NtrC family response regulator
MNFAEMTREPDDPFPEAGAQIVRAVTPGVSVSMSGSQGDALADEVAREGLKAIARRAAMEAERAVLKDVLDRVRWNRLEAARRLKISYKTLRVKIRQCGLDAD